MEFVELKKHLKTQKPYACYVCYGDDDFLIERAVSLLCALASEPKPFNCTDREFDGGRALTDELMQLPIMGDYRVVVARGKTDAAAVSGYLSIRLVRMVASQGRFGIFAYYCWAAGAVTIALSILKTLELLPWLKAAV